MRKRKFNPFEEVALKAVNGSVFDLSHDLKTSYDPGLLVPVLSIECVPGDQFTISMENMHRLAPLIAPVMHRMKLKTQFFFVPNRLLWDDWEDWITMQSTESAPYVEFGNVPDTASTKFALRSIGDYLGYPTENCRWVRMSPLPIYAYWKIYADWYRDQNLEADSITLDFKAIAGQNFVGDADERTQLLLRQPAYANWERDYFTACLPEPQFGDPVLIPLFQEGAEVEVLFNTNLTDTGMILRRPNGTNVPNAVSLGSDISANLVDDTPVNVGIDPNGMLVVGSQINFAAASINDLRLANITQEFLERMMRAGRTYKDMIWAHFQTRTRDERLQRAEFLGSIHQNMLISEVLSTAETTDLPQANMAGHGISVAKSETIRYNVTEHGWIIGIQYAVPDTAYFQGVHRSLTKLDPFDYLWPSFANIGEQPVYNKEIYIVDGVTPAPENDETFGYLPVYSDYRFLNSRVTGDMRDTLDFWHWARKFETPPALDEGFTKASDVPLRTFAVEDTEEAYIWSHIFFQITAYRKLPKYGIPSL